MKTLINKLFERLGYVPKSKCQDAEAILHNINTMDVEIIYGVNKYQTLNCTDKIFVTAYSDTLGKHRIIKVFPKGGTEDSADYARICAEELCDMLNENIKNNAPQYRIAHSTYNGETLWAVEKWQPEVQEYGIVKVFTSRQAAENEKQALVAYGKK